MSIFYAPQYKTTTLNVAGGIDVSQTTGIVLANVDNVTTSVPGIICVTYARPLDTTVAEFISYTSISGSKELEGVTRGAEGIAAKTHSNNAVIGFVVSKSHINNLADLALANVRGTSIYGADGGTGDAYTITVNSNVAAYAAGNMFVFKAATANTGACTLAVNSLAAKAIKVLKDQTPPDNFITVGSMVTVVYDGTNFQVISVMADLGYRSMMIPAGFLAPTTTSGCEAKATVELATNDIDYDHLGFDKDSDENAFANITMPESYDGGAIQFRYYWTTNTGGGAAETVMMELAGRSFASGDAGDQANGTAVEVEDVWEADKDMMISGWSADITLAGTPAGGELVHLELTRDVSEDDLAEDARIMAIQIRYKINKYSEE